MCRHLAGTSAQVPGRNFGADGPITLAGMIIAPEPTPGPRSGRDATAPPAQREA